MKSIMTAFFLTRLVLYIGAFAVPVIHPAIVVPYDRLGWWLWFGVLPLEMLVAFLLVPPRVSARVTVSAALVPAAAAALFAASGLVEATAVFGVALFALASTWFIFHTSAYSRVVASFEPFLLVVLYYRLLRFSRASEEIAAAAGPLPQVLLVLIPATFLIHTLTLYGIMYRAAGPRRTRREFAALAAIAAGLLALVALVFPHDFVSHSPITNLLRDDRSRDRQSLDDWADRREDSDVGLDPAARDGREHGGLEGIPSDQWGENVEDGGEPDKQYAVMVVAGGSGPVYAADTYYSVMHPQRGFERPRDKELNELSRMRLLETWRSVHPEHTGSRSRNDTFFLSSRPERYLQYNPTRITPTTFTRRYHPFSYEYAAEAKALDGGVGNARNWQHLTDLDEGRKRELERYLDVPLEDDASAAFERHLDQHLGDWRAADSNPAPGAARLAYHRRIDAILRSFSEFQYEAGYDDDVSIGHMVRFISSDRTGDCVEFSHTTAILARMAGIPARVVTGYLAAVELQTPSHRRGTAMLRDQVEPLQQYDLNDLYLVTTAHRHAWVQFYLRGYGWVEFETTSHAIPPVGHGDPNLRDVVIPMLQDTPVAAPSPSVPWALLGRAAAAVAAAVTAFALGYRHTRELYLARLARRPTERGAEALYRLLLLRTAARGIGVKAGSETACEFAERIPEAREFAELYTRLRYRTRWSTEQREAAHAELWHLYSETLRQTRSAGISAPLRAALSLRGLRYQW